MSDSLLNYVADAATELGRSWALIVGPTDQFGRAEVLLLRIKSEFSVKKVKTERTKMYADEIWWYVRNLLVYELGEVNALLGRKKLPIYALGSQDTISPADYHDFLTLAISGEPDAVGG